MKLKTTQNFNEVLKTIQTSKQKALQQVNTTLIELYWEVGKYISTKTISENWGKSVVKELAKYIKEKEPTIKGFSDKNLWRMKQFYEIYKDNEKLSTLSRELSWSNNLAIFSSSKTMDEMEFYTLLAINERYSFCTVRYR